MPTARHTHALIGSTAVGVVAESLEAFCVEERLPAEVAWRLRVAIDEVVSNITVYGPAGGPAALDVWFRRDGDTVEITVEDDGPPFDPLARPAPDLRLPLESRQPGGLGIALVRALIDDVGYARTERNVLTLRKHLHAHRAD